MSPGPPPNWKPGILTPSPALCPLPTAGSPVSYAQCDPPWGFGLWLVAAAPPAIQPHFHPEAPPPPRALLPSSSSDLSLMSVPCHKTMRFLKAGVGFPCLSVLYRTWHPAGAQEIPVQRFVGQMDLELRGPVSPLTSALPPAAIPDRESWQGPEQTSLSESHRGAGTSPRSPAGNQRAATCAHHPTESLEGSSLLCFSLLPATPSAQPPLGFGRIKAQSLF